MVTQLPHRHTPPRPAARRAGLHLSRLAAVLGALTCALLSLAAPAAFASIPVPGPGGAFGPVPGGTATVTRLITAGGTPGWQIALIALGAALVGTAALYPDLDLGRVGIRGWSFGGTLAAAAVLRRPDVFHCAIAGAAPTDAALYAAHYGERFLGKPQDNPEGYRRGSILYEAANLKRPA
jgi:pimeloyl-ACP methyl ester carboxylesterase